jgi:hypothetical protein
MNGSTIRPESGASLQLNDPGRSSAVKALKRVPKHARTRDKDLILRRSAASPRVTAMAAPVPMQSGVTQAHARRSRTNPRRPTHGTSSSYRLHPPAISSNP